jgi:hypothetical protein
MEGMVVKDRLRLLLKHFGEVRDPHDPAKVRYPLPEVLFLVTRAGIAGCDDYDEIADWGAHRLDFLRGYGEYYFGTPEEDWLRTLLNRIDPALFEACVMAWATALRADGTPWTARRCAAAGTAQPGRNPSVWSPPGPRAPLRLQYHPRRTRQAIQQDHPQGRRLGPLRHRPAHCKPES